MCWLSKNSYKFASKGSSGLEIGFLAESTESTARVHLKVCRSAQEALTWQACS